MGLTQYEERIQSLFITKIKNNVGAYAVTLLIQGEEHIITIDDLIACKKNGHPAFSKSRLEELWLILLEKAWAKINGNYMNTWLGTPQEAFWSFSRAPCVYEYNLSLKNQIDKYRIWNIIIQAFNNKWVICTNTDELGKKRSDELGLVSLHAYSILKIFSFKNLKLLKLRNPWGDKEWKGDYSNHSILWTDELKSTIGKEDLICKKGTFFLKYEDFLNYFPWTYICQIEDNYFYNISKFKYDKKFMTAFIEVKENTKCFLTLHQPQKRFNQDIIKFEIPLGIIIVFKFENNENILIKSEMGNTEKIVIELILTKGYYKLFFRSLWNYNTEPIYNVSTYSDNPIPIYKFPKEYVEEDWIEKILIRMAKNSTNLKYHKKNSISSYVLKETSLGYGIYYFENKSVDVMNAKVEIQEIHGARILNKTDINIQPGSYKIILLEVLEHDWSISSVLSVSFQTIYRDLFNSKYHLSEKYYMEKGLKVFVIKENGFFIITENKSIYKYNGTFIFPEGCSILNEELGEDLKYQFTTNSNSFNYIKVLNNNELNNLEFQKKFIKIL